MPQWSVAEWRARIGGSWLAIGRQIKTRSLSSSGGAGCMQRVLTVNRMMTMMSLTLVLIGVNLLLRALLSRGHLRPITDLLKVGILSHCLLYWINFDYLLLTDSTMFSLYIKFFPSTIIRQLACSLKQGTCLTSRLLYVLASLKRALICPLLLLVTDDRNWLRAVSVLRMMTIAGDQVTNSSVVKEELELKDRGEILRRLALSSAQLDVILSVAVYVIIYKLLKSGDIEKNPGPGNLDYNSVDTSHILDEDDLSDVMEEVLSIRSLFYQLGRCLKLKIVDLNPIRDTHRSDSDTEQAFESVLLLWLNKTYNVERFGPPTWQMLVKAVDMESGGNDHKLANQIASRHPAVSSDCVQSPTPSPQAKEGSKENPWPAKKESEAEEHQSRHATEADRVGKCTEQTYNENLGIKNTREVLDVLWKHRAKWRLVGIELGIASNDLDAIKVNTRTVEDSLFDMINYWLCRVNPKPTRAVLTKVAQSSLLVAEADTQSVISTQEGYKQRAEEYTQYLKFLYKARTLASFSDDQWPPPCTDKVFRLAMIKSEEMRRGHTGDDAALRERTVSGKVDDVLQRKVPVKIQDIFEVKNQHKEVRKVLMEGAPGSGKSTLSFHMCHQWMEGHLFQEFKLVILVKLRESAIQNAKSLAELLPRRNETMGTEIEDTITASDGKDVLFILDGWDELPRNVPVFSLILDLVNGQRLPATSIIVTSRPTSSATLHPLVHLQIEILGFTKDELQHYFMKCLENRAEAAQRLLERIKQNPIIEGSCYLPLNASILIHLFKCRGNVLPTTQYGIFTDLVCSCIYRHLKKTHQDVVKLNSLDDLPRSTADQFRCLCKVAYDGVMQDKVIFDFGPNFNTLGLLQGVESFAIYGKSYSYNFLHLSIQELLCALHMANELDEREQTEQFKELFGQPRFMLVFRFFAAKTKLKTSGISEIVTQVAKKCSGDDPSREDRTLLVSFMHCLFEAQDSSLCQLVASKLNHKLMLSYTRFNPTDCYYLGYFLTFCTGFNVDLSYCSIGADHCKSLFRCGQTYNVRSLCLQSNSISDEGAMVVAEAMKTATNLQKLYFQHTDIGREGAIAVATVMKTAPNLQELHIGFNDIRDEGAVAVATAMKTATNLHTLLLRCNAIGKEGAMAVAAAMNTTTKLQTLYIGGNNIGREAEDAIRAAAMKTGTEIDL